jgi:hypothetical protein
MMMTLFRDGTLVFPTAFKSPIILCAGLYVLHATACDISISIYMYIYTYV